MQYAERNQWIKVKEGFLWHREMQTPMLRDRSNLPPSARKIKYIAPEEIGVAIEKVVKDSIAIQPDLAVPFIAKMLGFARVTEDMKTDILEIIQRCIDQKLIYREGQFLKLVS